MVFTFPTLLYAASIAVRVLMSRSGKEQELPEAESSGTKKKFEFGLLADCLILNLVNGMIVIFGVGQVDFGIAVAIAGVMISLFGISSLFTETDEVRELLLTISNILILGEMLDFATYSFAASAGLIVGLVALLLYYSIRVSGAFESAPA